MIVRFDALDRFETPKFYLCNPGCTYNAGILSNTLGCLSDTTDEELILNFNTTSELNFRINKVVRGLKEEDQYTNKLYKAIQNRRLIFVEDVGFFIINDVVDGFDKGIQYKDVRAESCEYEISQKSLPYIEDGTYNFMTLLERIVSSLPLWTIGDVNLDVASKYRTFEDVSIELNALSFLLENMQDAFECIIICDIINREINVYDQNHFVRQTDIHITKDDLINSIEINENSDDLYTALMVQGDENLNISPVNPLGNNMLYNFSYYLDWMTSGLSERVKQWQDLVREKESEYYDLNLQYYDRLTNQSGSNSELEMLRTQLEMYQRMRDNVVAESATTTVKSYNEIIVKNGGVPVGVMPELNDTIDAIDELIDSVKAKIAKLEQELDGGSVSIDELLGRINEIRNSVSILSFFSDKEYAELSNYIFEGNYTDEYIAVTDSMSYAERFEKMKILYDRSVDKLIRISEPTQEFSIDIENFIFDKRFSDWSSQLETGSLINVEIDTGDIAALFLSNITVNYYDKKLTMTFGNRFNRFDPKAMFSNILGDVKKSANSLNYIKEILYPVKNGEFDAMREAIESSQILTKNMALTSTDQEILIDDTGILCRRMKDNGEYDPRQLKVTNQTIVFTEDAWNTANTAVGDFVFNNPVTGETEEHYGVIADMLVGHTVLSENSHIYNSDSSILMDENGFTMTTDFRDPNEPNRKTFKIRKLQTDEDGNEFYNDQMYLDTNGNLVLNGTLSVFTSSGDTTNLEDLTGEYDGITMDEVSQAITNQSATIYEEINNKYSNILSEANSQINTAVRSEIASLKSSMEEKYDQIIDEIESELTSHKAEIGQYMTFNDSGLTLGATSSDFKTVIDNSGMYFNQGDTIVSYVNNNQLYIPNAVIESTLIFGNFFYSPREDGGFSLIWQERD